MSPTRLPYHGTEDLDLGLLRRIGVLAFGVVCYLAFLASFLYLLAFLVNASELPLPAALHALVPTTIDGGAVPAPGYALLVDLMLVTLFALQHSVMARSGFKDWLRSSVEPATERSVYVLASSICLALLCALWQPLPATIWRVEALPAVAALWALFGAGVVLVLVATFLIDHFELFGLRQSWDAFLRRRFVAPRFATPWLAPRVCPF